MQGRADGGMARRAPPGRSPLGSLHLPLHLLQKKSVGRVAGRAAAETADGMTEQNSLCKVGGSQSSILGWGMCL